jgi:hypothetical protein
MEFLSWLFYMSGVGRLQGSPCITVWSDYLHCDLVVTLV